MGPRKMLPYGFTAFNGRVWHNSDVDGYNNLQAQINSFIEDGREVPETLLNSSHHIFSVYSRLI